MASGMKAELTWDTSEVQGKLTGMAAKFVAALMQLGSIVAARIQTAARSGRIWIDRTVQARNGLTARASMEGLTLVITLFHLAPHGLWLEVAMGQKYAIIMKTLQSQYPHLVAMLSGLLAGL